MILEAKNVYRSFDVGQQHIDVLNGINLAVPEGKFIILMGPSGSGKTTLMNQLCLLDRPTEGEVYLFGERADDISEKQRDQIRSKEIGIIFQSVALISKMTAYENLDFSLRIAHYPQKERKERIIECISKVGLEKRIHHMPAQMSGGEEQRVAIARAIAHRPKLIFADEPTAQLDTETSIRIMSLLRKMVEEEKTTIIMTTHDINMAVFGDEIIQMKDGRVQ